MTETDIDALGPIDYVVIEFPADRPPNGSARPLLRDLVERGIIPILDLAFVRKDTNGTLSGVDIADLGLEGDIDITLLAEAGSGLLDDADSLLHHCSTESGRSQRGNPTRRAC